jgi:hypothetical protein
MHFPDINKYIAKFEELARQVGYTTGNSKMIHMFIKGLTPTVMEDVVKPLHAQEYHAIKQKAIECTWLRVLLDNILKARQPGGQGFQGGVFRGFQQGGMQWQPFFSRQNTQNQLAPAPRYNLPNALAWMNNQPVPMDVGCNRVPNYQGGASA